MTSKVQLHCRLMHRSLRRPGDEVQLFWLWKQKWRIFLPFLRVRTRRNSSWNMARTKRRQLEGRHLLFGEYLQSWTKKIQSEIEADDQLWTSNTSHVARLFRNEVVFLLKITLFYDKHLLSGQPPLSGHLPVPRGWPLNGAITVD